MVRLGKSRWTFDDLYLEFLKEDHPPYFVLWLAEFLRNFFDGIVGSSALVQRVSHRFLHSRRVARLRNFVGGTCGLSVLGLRIFGAAQQTRFRSVSELAWTKRLFRWAGPTSSQDLAFGGDGKVRGASPVPTRSGAR